MALSEAYSGTETVTTDEWSLTGDDTSLDAITTDGIYQCFVELHNLAAGDVFEFKIYEKVLSSSTQRLVYSATFSGVQGEPVWVSPTLLLIHGWDMSLNKISGTDRSINWSIRAVT
jgi:hypothetical protein